MASSRLVASLMDVNKIMLRQTMRKPGKEWIKNFPRHGKSFGRRRVFLDGKIFGRRHVRRRHKRCPSLSRLRFVFHRPARDRRNADEMIAAGTLNFAAGKLLVALQMLLALRAGEFEFAHASFRFLVVRE